MIIQLMSDIHLEFHHDKGEEFLNSLNPTNVDVLVLAGDICSAKHTDQVKRVFELVAHKYPNIIYILGNHEYYGTNPTDVWNNIKRVASRFPNIHTLNNEIVTINGQRFIGGTGWFPYDKPSEPYQFYMTDFRIIRDFEPWVYESHATMEALLQAGCCPNDIVVTHHLPTVECIADKYKGQVLNAFFHSKFDEIVSSKQPKIWFFGHTHEQFDFKIGSTRLVCNPRGYPTELEEQAAFQDRLIIEV